MKTILLVCALISTIAFADVHPALKNAIDKGDIKTAQNLVQKIGVEDVYCPAGLSFDDAVKIYGDAFEKNSSMIWEKCDVGFIENMEKKACEKSVGLCKEILKHHDESEWTPFVEQIVNNKLNYKKVKLKIKKKIPVRVSKKECLRQYNEAKVYLKSYEEEFLRIFCDPKDKNSVLLCPYMKTQIADSLALILKEAESLCKKKSMILKDSVVEENVVANSFWYEAEKFGQYISLKLANVFDTTKAIVSLYEKFVDGFPDTSMSNIHLAIDEIFKSKDKKMVMQNLGLACHVFPNIKEYFNENKYAPIIYKGMYNSVSVEEYQYVKAFEKWSDFARTNGFNSQFFDCSSFPYTNSLGYEKKDALQTIISSYAKQGFVNYWEVSFYCKRYPGLEKEIQKQTEIEMYNCDILDDFKKVNDICIENDSTFVWVYFYSAASARYPFVCENKKWRGFTKEELATGKLCDGENYGEFVGEYVCDRGQWRKSSKEEKQIGEICDVAVNDEKIVNGYYCENNTWKKLWGIAAQVGNVCKPNKNQGLFAENFVCDVDGWRVQTQEESATHKLCTKNNLGAFADKYVCDEDRYNKNIKWRMQTDEEKKTRKICSTHNSNQKLNGYICKFGPPTKKCESKAGFICGSENYESTWHWEKMSGI